ncbi:hypothetical protein [Singulisphaera sp. PoT]|uniref:hypothetical protein n=1 Tax=Singulisphaera sp. PoT TaxID=3411797 RepID=UPI003BF5B85B
MTMRGRRRRRRGRTRGALRGLGRLDGGPGGGLAPTWGAWAAGAVAAGAVGRSGATVEAGALALGPEAGRSCVTVEAGVPRVVGRSGATDEAGPLEAGRVAVEAVALMAGVSGGLGRDEGGAVGVGDDCSRGGPAGGADAD